MEYSMLASIQWRVLGAERESTTDKSFVHQQSSWIVGFVCLCSSLEQLHRINQLQQSKLWTNTASD